MGEIAATMTKKKKKKGRPSLLDLQKRSLKQQQQHKNPNSPNAFPPTPHRRSARRNPNLDTPERINHDGNDDDDERKEKKHKLLLGLNSQHNNATHHFPNSLGLNSSSYADNPEVGLKRSKISAPRFGSDEMGEKALKVTDTLHESPVEPGPTTPLPDKKLLVFILDRLQKKDTYGVFSDPVDSEELPDYHDIVEHPMDFSTVRKKLDARAYVNLEQFEKDVFLICSNAMQYNFPDTIYFRQARSIQELAKKDFENLRHDSGDGGEPQPKIVRRGRPPGKLKKSLEMSHLDRVKPECSSDATLPSGGDNTNLSTGYNLRRTHLYKYQPADVLVRTSYGSHSNDYSTWMSEWENEFPVSVLKAVLKYGKKPHAVDENRRETYKHPLDSTHGPSNLNIFEGELKQLIAVGLNSEHGYARSLARFAADLGPVVWKIASKKIESVLPRGLEYGPGWVGEDKVVEGQQQLLFSDRQKGSGNSMSNDHLSRLHSLTTAGMNSTFRSKCSAWGGEDVVENVGGLSSQSKSSSLNSCITGINPMSFVPVQQKPMIQSDANGFSGGIGYNNCSHLIGTARLGVAAEKSCSEHTTLPSQVFGMVSASNTTFSPLPGNDFSLKKANLSETSSALLCEGTSALDSIRESQTLLNAGIGGKASWQGLTGHQQEDFFQFPPDLNIGFLAPHSPSSSVPIGSPQPDLALQL